MGKPEILSKKHTDWPWLFRWVPRSWTAFDWGAPKKMAGTQIRKRHPAGSDAWAPAPIGEPRSWQVSRYPGAPGVLKYLPTYIAWTTAADRHYRIGARWDDVDGYSTWSAATRKYPMDGDRETSVNAK